MRVRTEAGSSVVALRGELDMATIPSLHRETARATDVIVIDAREGTK